MRGADEKPATLWSYVSANPYAGYVLVVCTLTYLLNQLDRYEYGVASIPFVDKVDFGLITGPLFTVIYTLAGVAISYGGSRFNQRYVLAASLLFWSACTALTGLATNFTEVALARVGQGLGEAGCTPFAAAIIAGHFPKSVLGTAISFYNVGIYTGYSLALGLGTYVENAVSGWAAGYVIFGAAGGVVALLVVTLRAPRASDGQEQPSSDALKAEAEAPPPPAPAVSVRELARYWLSSPTLLLLCLAGGIRNAGGYVWAYQTKPFFTTFQGVTPDTFSAYMGWIPLVGGSLGALTGGFVSDRLVKRVGSDGKPMGAWGRVLLIIVSNLAAAPFAAGALTLPVPTAADSSALPWGFLCLLPSNIIGEMWIGVCMTLVVETVPAHLKSTTVALYLFIITNIGGNMPLMVPVLQSSGLSLRASLLILFPGLYVLSSVLFLLMGPFLRRDFERARLADAERERLLSSSGNDDGSETAVRFGTGGDDGFGSALGGGGRGERTSLDVYKPPAGSSGRPSR